MRSYVHEKVQSKGVTKPSARTDEEKSVLDTTVNHHHNPNLDPSDQTCRVLVSHRQNTSPPIFRFVIRITPPLSVCHGAEGLSIVDQFSPIPTHEGRHRIGLGFRSVTVTAVGLGLGQPTYKDDK